MPLTKNVTSLQGNLELFINKITLDKSEKSGLNNESVVITRPNNIVDIYREPTMATRGLNSKSVELARP